MAKSIVSNSIALCSAFSLIALTSTAALSQDVSGIRQICQKTEGVRSANQKKKLDMSIDARLDRQRKRIKRALDQGRITAKQAKNLSSGVSEIEGKAKTLKSANGGSLKKEDIAQLENSLNQSNELILSTANAGKRSVQSGDVLGARWAKGADGAQNPKKLKQEMKRENRRELRQYRQANEQKIEQQQLDYEKEMVEKLGDQRKDVLKEKENLKDVRKDSGAD